MIRNEKTKHFIDLIKENPTLPVVAMVDSDVVGDDDYYCRWIGSFGNSYIGECAFYDDRYFDDRHSFGDYYYDANADELDEKFNYEPNINEYTVQRGKYTEEQFLANKKNEELLEKYINDIANRHFIKVIFVNINSSEF